MSALAGRLVSQGAGRAGLGASRRPFGDVRPCPFPVFELPISSSIPTSSCVTHVPCPCVTHVPCLSVTYVRLHTNPPRREIEPSWGLKNPHGLGNGKASSRSCATSGTSGPRTSPVGMYRLSREGREDLPHALKGHFGALSCGGVSHKADDIPAPTRTTPVMAVPPPLPHLFIGGKGWWWVGVGMSRRHPNARTWARLSRRRISPRGVIVPHRNRTRFFGGHTVVARERDSPSKPPRGWRSQSTPLSRQCRSGSHRRKSFKIHAKTSYQDKNDVKRVVFGHTDKKGCHILSIFWHTFCVRKSTDCAIEFGL